MTLHDFDELVRRMERRHAGRPRSLERATTAWMAAGLAAFVALVLFLFGLGLAAFAAGVMLPFESGIWLLLAGVAAFLYATSQAFLLLSVDHAPPSGRLLTPSDAPGLSGLLESLRSELQCPPFDEVRITMEYNAGISEVPRLGFLGWPRMFLQLGLPLMEALTVDELTAVLAHEMAHCSGRHARSNNRIYRLHRTWTTLFERMQRPAASSFQWSLRLATVRVAHWYWPRLHARAMVLSRAHEYHADRVAAGHTGAAPLVSALWRMECLNPMLAERFWLEVFRAAEHSPEPPADILDRLRLAFHTPVSPADASRWIDRALARATGHDETHPALSDRSRALGWTEDDCRRLGFPEAPRPSAAEALIDGDAQAIHSWLAAQWRREVAADWWLRHQRAAATLRREAAGPSIPTDTAAVAGPPTPSPDASDAASETVAAAEPASASAATAAAEAWEAARSSLGLRGVAESVPLLRSVLNIDPCHPQAALVLGSHLLELGDPEGNRLLEMMAELGDGCWTRQALQALHDHFQATGQTTELEEMRGRLDRFDEESAAAQHERSNVRFSDTFLAHGLPDDAISALRSTLDRHESCQSAWLARKALRYFPNRPLFVLAVRGTGRGWLGADANLERQLVSRLTTAVELPGQLLIVGRSGPFTRLAQKVALGPGAEVYRRDRPRVGDA